VRVVVAYSHDLWKLVWGQPWIDANDLALAVEEQAVRDPLDYRTRLLIRDSVDALKQYWDAPRWNAWFARTPARQRLATICAEPFERVGFPFIRESLMEKTDPEVVYQMLRELSRRVRKPLRMPIGGSIALIIPGMLARATADIDIVDEVPEPLRSDHELLNDLERRYKLKLTHFQQHYLPSGWENRLHYHDTYGDLAVYLVDPLDVFLSKLTSIRTKDLDDLRVLASQFDKATIIQRMKDTMKSAFASADLLERAKNTWYILFGEDLPT
jgi:hypothetical protein